VLSEGARAPVPRHGHLLTAILGHPAMITAPPARGEPSPGGPPVLQALLASWGMVRDFAAHLFQRNGHVRDEQQVILAQDDLDLGAGGVQPQRAARLGGDGDRTAAGLNGHESQASLHILLYTATENA
jgi:hypothetical protein